MSVWKPPKQKIITNPPKAVEPVLEYIRRSVPKPSPPMLGCTRFTLDCLVFRGLGKWGKNVECCPMGLLPEALCARPFRLGHFDWTLATRFPQLTNYTIADFANWWDRQHDSAHAMRMVWGV